MSRLKHAWRQRTKHETPQRGPQVGATWSVGRLACQDLRVALVATAAVAATAAAAAFAAAHKQIFAATCSRQRPTGNYQHFGQVRVPVLARTRVALRQCLRSR